MDLGTITDINTLKAMAYDAIAQKELAERNLQAINGRIAQLSMPSAPPKVPGKPPVPGPSVPPENAKEPTGKPPAEGADKEVPA